MCDIVRWVRGTGRRERMAALIPTRPAALWRILCLIRALESSERNTVSSLGLFGEHRKSKW